MKKKVLKFECRQTESFHFVLIFNVQSSVRMTTISNSNIIYSGDADKVSDKPWVSLGKMVLSDLSEENKRDLFVSIFKRIKSL